jgi:hypothetical protein
MSLSPSSSNSSSSLVATLSPQELSRLVTDADFNPALNEVFPAGSVSTAILRHYLFLSQSIDTLERELERHQLEREQLFDCLKDNGRFRQRIKPVLREFRVKNTRIRRTRPFHPYNRASSSSRSSTDPPRSIVIRPRNADALAPQQSTTVSPNSFHTAIEQPLGSRANPIIVEESDDACSRCHYHGHDRPNCTTSLRTFTHCTLCDWAGQTRSECNHYDTILEWVKRQDRSLDAGV